MLEHPFESVPGTDAECFIQWKGTDVCVDIYCDCGKAFHIDGMFAYAVICPYCQQMYEMGTQVKLKRCESRVGMVPLTDPDPDGYEWKVSK